MYYVVCDSGVYASDNLKKINDTLRAQIDEDEFTCLGSDKIIKVTSADIDFVQDKRKMSRIFFGNFFREDKSIKIFVILSAIFSILSTMLLMGK